jgi:hypothetical protein
MHFYKTNILILFQIVSTVEKTSRVSDFRFIREARGGLTINNVMLEDDGIWQCEAENFRGYVENARPIKLVVLGEFTKILQSISGVDRFSWLQ